MKALGLREFNNFHCSHMCTQNPVHYLISSLLPLHLGTVVPYNNCWILCKVSCLIERMDVLCDFVLLSLVMML